MPHIVCRITAPTQSIHMNIGPIGIKNIRLIQYQGEGLTQPGVLYFEITDQSTTSIQGNVGSSFFPLMMDRIPVAKGPSMGPIWINEGNSLWNNSKLLTFKVNDANMKPAVFSVITLLLQYDETEYPEQCQKSGPEHEQDHWAKPETNKMIDRKNLNWFYDHSTKVNVPFFLPQ